MGHSPQYAKRNAQNAKRKTQNAMRNTQNAMRNAQDPKRETQNAVGPGTAIARHGFCDARSLSAHGAFGTDNLTGPVTRKCKCGLF